MNDVSKSKLKVVMIITGVLMCLEFLIQFVGVYAISNATGQQLINVNTVLNIIDYIVVMAFLYTVYANEDFKTIGVIMISIWGIINIMPMINQIIAPIQSLTSGFQPSTVASLLYMLIIMLVFAFIVLISINYVVSKKQIQYSTFFLSYIIPILMIFLAMLTFNMWLKYNGLINEISSLTLVTKSFLATFFLTINVLKYIIAVLVIKKRKVGYYLLMIVVLMWYVMFFGKSLTIFMNTPISFMGSTVIIYLVPFIYHTYTLVMSIIISIKGIVVGENAN